LRQIHLNRPISHKLFRPTLQPTAIPKIEQPVTGYYSMGFYYNPARIILLDGI
jgi:hypothetical protein